MVLADSHTLSSHFIMTDEQLLQPKPAVLPTSISMHLNTAAVLSGEQQQARVLAGRDR